MPVEPQEARALPWSHAQVNPPASFPLLIRRRIERCLQARVLATHPRHNAVRLPVLASTLAVIGVLMSLGAPAIRGQQPGPPASISLDSLLNTHISTASKYEQTSVEAPASVTILTVEDLQKNGYRTLQEALENVRGFYISNDRNYPLLGTRGFSRPSDYNNRVLLLVDGHTLNDQTWGGAPIGSDLPINFDAVERIEIVRGPGSALYGTNAVFAVINIVTKTAQRLAGTVGTARVGSGGLREAAVAGGYSLGQSSSLAFSGLISRRDGSDLYYSQFDSPLTNNGVAHALDWEHAVGGLAALTLGDVVAHVGYRSRDKGIPTAAFSTVFNDPRAMTVDETLWGDVTATRDVSGHVHLSGRAYADRYRYRGAYPYITDPAYSDGGGSTDVGAEVIAVLEETSRNQVTMGTEFRRVLRSEYYELPANGVRTSDNEPTSVFSAYTQDELQLTSALRLVGGLRWDWNTRNEDAFTPRLALIFTPSPSTTVKALYGRAFRAPSTAEADITTTYYVRNPALQPEQMQTLELDVEYRVNAAILASGALYGYRMINLIDQVQRQKTGEILYDNVTSSEGTGVELEVDVRPSGPLSAHAWYSVSHADMAPARQRLTNSPEQTGVVSVTARHAEVVSTTLLFRYESGRRTISGPSTQASTRTDLNVNVTPPGLSHVEVGLRITNLLDVSYSTPGGLEHVQYAIEQDGRAAALRLTWRL
ncbi:MAG: TonB-dependent receptor [Gemmatimonadetes bacterium]|nr:TonB-dependent receptor [Gemmatimonadota bacterium]